MANVLKMALQQAIVALWRRGWSFRRIADELGVHRETVSRYVRLEADTVGAQVDTPSKPAKVTAGNEASDGPKPAKVTAGNEASDGPKPAKVTAGLRPDKAGNPASRSRCEPLRALIQEKLDAELSAQRIYQDLVAEHGFTAGYECVKRFVRRLRQGSPLPFRRMECEPGQEAQVDFGRGAPIIGPDGSRLRPHVFRIVLSHSRKGYSEAVLRQSTESFVRALENAFWHFGGAPRTLVIDNLRAAVQKADWYDPELNPKIEAFCRHCGTVILPARPCMPRHKGKVERGIGYVKDNALKARTFGSLAEQNRHLAQWEAQVADHRIHGTTRRQVRTLFEERERPALLPLPAARFPFFHEGRRVVHRDAHVEVDRAYYSVPPEYVGRRVWVRWDLRLVRICNGRMEQIALHVRAEPGRFRTAPEHIASEKISAVERGAGALLKRASLLGHHTRRWAESMLQARGIQGVRVLQGLLAMAGRYRADQIERACELALTHEAFRLKELRALMHEPLRQTRLSFAQEHPLIRPMEHYGRIVRVEFRPDPGDGKDEFNAWGATSGEPATQQPAGKPPREGPALNPEQALPAVQPPASALGSLSSGALSSGSAQPNLSPRSPSVNSREGRYE